MYNNPKKNKKEKKKLFLKYPLTLASSLDQPPPPLFLSRQIIQSNLYGGSARHLWLKVPTVIGFPHPGCQRHCPHMFLTPFHFIVKTRNGTYHHNHINPFFIFIGFSGSLSHSASEVHLH